MVHIACPYLFLSEVCFLQIDLKQPPTEHAPLGIVHLTIAVSLHPLFWHLPNLVAYCPFYKKSADYNAGC